MSVLTIKRLIGLLVVLALVHGANSIAREFADERERSAHAVSELSFAYEQHVLRLRAELDRVARESQDAEELYRDRLMEIATALYEHDYYNMGGYATPEGESLVILYETVLNGVRDYRELLGELDNYFDARREYVDSVPSVWPISWSSSTRITSGFGWRLSPITGRPHLHTGIDIAGPWNSQVIATADGVVVEHWPPPGIYGGRRFRGHEVLGGMVKILHEGGIETVYAHLSSTRVATGQEVSRGDVIGVMGNTGMSTGAHLHYEIHVDGKPVDPIGFLRL